MRTVEYDGDRYLLVTYTDESCRVRDPATGEERYLPTDEVTITGRSPLETAAAAVPEPARRLVTAVHDERALGLLVALDAEPRSARVLLEADDVCEADLHGLVGELIAAGLLVETDVDGEHGYRTTATASAGLDVLLDRAGRT